MGLPPRPRGWACKKLKAAVESLYYKLPTAAELEGTSYTVEDFADNEPEVNLWPENWRAIELFCKFSTQWRCGSTGPMSLDLNVFFSEMQRKKIPDDEQDTLIEQLAIIESEALKCIYRK